MKMTFSSMADMEEHVSALADEKKWVIDIFPKEDGKIEVQWIEHKSYTTHDGKEFPDEAWMTKEGELILVQDLTEAHARNVLRMLLRQDREAQAMASQLSERIMEAIQGMADDEETGENTPSLDVFGGHKDSTDKPTLH